MEKSKMLWIATKYNQKGYSQEQMRDGDDAYKESKEVKDQIAEYMEEIEDSGRIAFYEKYKEYKLY